VLTTVVFALLIIGLLVMRPWQVDDDRWFQESALLMAVLLGGLFVMLI
jgi:hypothetical protein